MIKGTGNEKSIELLFNVQNTNGISDNLFVLNESPFQNMLVIVSSAVIGKILVNWNLSR